MQKDILENFQKMTQANLESFKKLGETNLRIGEKLLQEQIGLTNSLLEAAASKAEGATEAKDFKDIASWQAEWAQEWSKQVMESSRNCAEIMSEAGKVYNGLFESCMKSCATEKTASKPRKAA
jgi:hypothetical protein